MRIGGTPAADDLPAFEKGRIGYDARIGAALRLQTCELRLAWVGAGRGNAYPVPRGQSRGSVVLSASYAF